MADFMTALNDFMSANSASVFSWFTLIIRFVLPVLALTILWRTSKSLLRPDDDLEEWGYLSLPNGAKIPLNHWENIVGRSKSSDAYFEYPTLSRSHAAIIRDDKGHWRIYDLHSKCGVTVNGREVTDRASLKNGDIVSLGGVELVFVTLGQAEQVKHDKERAQHQKWDRLGKHAGPSGTLIYLTAFQLALGLQLCISQDDTLPAAVPLSFLVLIALTWLTYIVTRLLRRSAFEVETIAFLLCSIGLAVTASSAPDSLNRQTVFLFAGLCLYFLIGWFIRDLDRAVKLRWPIAVGGLLILGVNLAFSDAVFGAKNWLSFSGISFQPSEFVKIAFVFAGAATLDRLFAKRNLILFIAYSGICVMALALMGDFGTALVFFIAYLLISFIRSGDLATLFLSIGGAGFAGFMAITLKPHVAARFATWGHAWETANAGGFQQARTMSAAASGGLLGVGGGNGWLKTVFAADTDMVFGVVSEELGLIVAVAAILALLIIAFDVIRSSKAARSTFYVIGASAAVSILLFQLILNVFGSVDILPFTGVTFPFVSKGGSSLISCWGLLAFIKAIDTRRGASFVMKAPKNIAKRETRAQMSAKRTAPPLKREPPGAELENDEIQVPDSDNDDSWYLK
jgi:cell division protein FtsW (lipid II flippase)